MTAYREKDGALFQLPPSFREPMGKAMAGEYSDAAKLGMDLRQARRGIMGTVPGE